MVHMLAQFCICSLKFPCQCMPSSTKPILDMYATKLEKLMHLEDPVSQIKPSHIISLWLTMSCYILSYN